MIGRTIAASPSLFFANLIRRSSGTSGADEEEQSGHTNSVQFVPTTKLSHHSWRSGIESQKICSKGQ